MSKSNVPLTGISPAPVEGGAAYQARRWLVAGLADLPDVRVAEVYPATVPRGKGWMFRVYSNQGLSAHTHTVFYALDPASQTAEPLDEFNARTLKVFRKRFAPSGGGR
jgi:hypothetical protein